MIVYPRKSVKDWLALRFYGSAFALLTGLIAASNRGRGTHTIGVGGCGVLRLLDELPLPPHPFFKAGLSFPVILRHGQVDAKDDAISAVRSASFRLGDFDRPNVFAVTMNSGPASVLYTGREFIDFSKAKMGAGDPHDPHANVQPWLEFFKADPFKLSTFQKALRRAPQSFTNIYYYSQFPLLFQAKDGHKWLIKLRLIPEHREPDTDGLLSEAEQQEPWHMARLPGEKRPTDYLRQEFKSRLAAAPISYILQVSLCDLEQAESYDVFHSGIPWDECKYPWRDLGILTLDQLLPDEVLERVEIDPFALPKGLAYPTASSMDDPNSILYLRQRVYGVSRFVRRLGYRRGRFPQAMDKPFDPDAVNVLSPQEMQEKYNQLTLAQQEEISALVANHLNVGTRPEPNLTHRALGRLVFEFDGPDGQTKPLHFMQVELWDRDVGNTDDLLAKGETDAEGYFEIWYDPAAAGFRDIPDLDLRIFAPGHIYHNDGTIEETKRLVHVISGTDDVTTQTYDFGTCRVPYWEYDPDAITPRVLIMEQGNPPQAYDTGRSVSLVKAAARVEALRRKHKLQHKLAPDSLTLNAVQNDFPLNLSRQLEQNQPGVTRSDAYFGDEILNGMTASVLDKDLENPNRYRLVHQWNAYEQDGVHVAPNVDMRFEVIGERLLPVEIHIGLRQCGVTTPNAPVTKYCFTPADGERWEQAKRIARCSAALNAELDAHLVTTHLNVEQYALAAHRNIRKNPLRWLLYPHLRDVTLVNHSANSFLLGEEGHITRAAALTADALMLRIEQTLGTHDWKNWRPRQPIIRTHCYAHVANLYWDLLTDYVDQFFAKHQADIEKYWLEVRRFSDDLVAHSVPLFLCGYLRRHARPGTATMQQTPAWYNTSERPDLTIIREPVQGVVRAISPITQTDTPSSEDLENMKQVCRYIIMHATLMHDWPNARQYEGGGEVTYMSLGLRYGANGPFALESDDSVAPPPLIASEQLFISYMLSNGGYGYVIKNESRDINPDFIRLLRQRAADFAALGLDVNMIQSRINI